MKLRIRKCTKEDFPSVLKLLQQLWPDKKLNEEDLKIVYNKAIESNNQKLIVCIKDNIIVGFCSLTVKNNLWQAGNLGHIDELVVDAHCRKKGIGLKLIDEITRIAKEMKCKRIELDTAFHRKEAHTFYENIGFENRAYLFSKELKF